MRNDPFFRSYMNQQPSRSARPVFVQQNQRKSSPKVVSVPVHFVSSEKPLTTLSRSKESAALTIQRAFRGFLVRKSVKKITSIRDEVSIIERRINDVEALESIRRDAKERLRVNETLMSLLFKLDSIRGVDCGVRDYRKAVIKKAISLQEKVDSVVVADYQTLDPANNDVAEIGAENACESTSEQVPEMSEQCHELVDDSVKLEVDEDDMVKVYGESGVVEEIVKEIDEKCSPIMARDEFGVQASVETSPTEVLTEVEKQNYSPEKVEDDCMELQKEKKGEGINDNKRNGELLEKLMDDNEKMMRLMMQIFEKNEMQTRMLNSLTQRVEQLEKAFICDKIRRKKKRHVA